MKFNKQNIKCKSALHLSYLVALVGCLSVSTVSADVLMGNSIVEGSLCTSDQSSCEVDEDFDAPGGLRAELKLKDNQPGIWFDTTGDNDWELDTSSSNFRVRATDGPALPARTLFRIEHGAPEDAFAISEEGFIGINQESPTDALDIRSPLGETAVIKVTNTGGSNNALHTILNLASNGPPSLRLRDNFNNETWQFRAKQNGGFTMNNAGTPGLEFEIEKDGRARFSNDLTVNGVVTQASSRTLKENFKAVDPRDILQRVNDLSIQQWNYIRDEDTVKHIGPIAEDFFDAFKLGTSDDRISSVDASGITIAAIQGLKLESDEVQQRLQEKELDIQKLNETLEEVSNQMLALQQTASEKDKRIAKLEQQLDRVSTLERAMANLVDQQEAGIQQSLFVQR